ncbi:MAG: CHAT domain-containing protein, partial [Bacteroidota bacterium]
MPEQKAVPFLYFAYANPEKDLPALKWEIENHYRICENSLTDGKFRFHQDKEAGKDQVDAFLKNFGPSVSIFHFSGHANNRSMKLADTYAFVTGIAESLKDTLRYSQKMVLVFLNACCTGEHARLLHEAGVPLVIGTLDEVEDKAAAAFSSQFFEELVGNRSSIRVAFEAAVEQFNRYNDNKSNGKGRPIEGVSSKPKKDETKANQATGWQLFCRSPEHEVFKDFQLNGNFEELQLRKPGRPRPNRHLVAQLCMALSKAGFKDMAGYLPEWSEAWAKQRTPDYSPAELSIAKAFPFTIEDDLLRLLQGGNSLDEFTQERFFHLMKIYQNLCELMLLIWFSQLWEACLGKDNGNLMLPAVRMDAEIGNEVKKKENDVPVSPEDEAKKGAEKLKLEKQCCQLLSSLKIFFDTPKTDRLLIDLVPFIQDVRKLCKALGIEPLMKEFVHLAEELENEKDFQDAYKFMRTSLEGMRKHTLEFSKPEKLAAACEEAEKHLTFFLKK